jgi:hypothetical protein
MSVFALRQIYVDCRSGALAARLEIDTGIWYLQPLDAVTRLLGCRCAAISEQSTHPVFRDRPPRCRARMVMVADRDSIASLESTIRRRRQRIINTSLHLGNLFTYRTPQPRQ